jgi:hypothetical protein
MINAKFMGPLLNFQVNCYKFLDINYKDDLVETLLFLLNLKQKYNFLSLLTDKN